MPAQNTPEKDAAMKKAEEIMEHLLRSGDEQLFNAARRPDGTVDQVRLVEGCHRATLRIAEKIRRGEI